MTDEEKAAKDAEKAEKARLKAVADKEAADKAAAEKAAKDAEKAEPQQVRVVRCLPNPATVHSGVTFATVQLGEGPAGKVHVSERISQEQAKRFCRVTGYSIFEGNEDECARAIEDALDEARKSLEGGAAGSSGSPLAQQLEEQQRINRRQSNEIADLRRRNDALGEEIATVKAENEALKAAGVRTQQL